MVEAAYGGCVTTVPEQSPLIEIGRIVNRHGIRGEVRLLPHNPATTALDGRPSAFLQAPEQAPVRYQIRGIRRHRHFLLLRLDQVETANAAEALVGCTVSVPREELPPPGPDAAYYYELIGCDVWTVEGERLGTVKGIFPTGSNDVCVVRDGSREYLIPIIADVVKQLDPVARKILIQPMPGLLEL